MEGLQRASVQFTSAMVQEAESGKIYKVNIKLKISRDNPILLSPYFRKSEMFSGYKFKDISSDKPSCTCPDWLKTEIPCKHFFAVFNNMNFSWNSCLQAVGRN